MSISRQSYLVTATFTCRVCGKKVSSSFYTGANPESFDVPLTLPENWTRTFGASGHGQYFQCPNCKHVLIDDSGRTLCFDHTRKKGS